MQTEPETLTAADVADVPTTTSDPTPDSRKRDSFLDGVAEYLKGGVMPSTRILAQVFAQEEPQQAAIDALDRRMSLDPRFVCYADGWDLAGLPPAEGAKSIGERLAEQGMDVPMRPAVTLEPTGVEPDGTPECPPLTVEPVEGRGSETIASETPVLDAIEATFNFADHEHQQTIDRLRVQLARAQDELAAYKAHAAAEKAAADRIKQAQGEVEAAKQVLTGKKAALAEAHLALLGVVTGDAQTEHPDLQPSDDEDDSDEEDLFAKAPVVKEAPAATSSPVISTAEPKPDAKEFSHTLPVEQVISDHGIDLLRLRASLRAELPKTEKPHQIGPAVVEVRGCEWLVRQHNDDQTRWFLQRVLTKDEWQQLHEQEFGRCVEGFDQHDEAKSLRTAGGDDCGRVVRVGKRKGVLGPEREGLVLVVTQADPFAPKGAAEPVHDGKAAAANDVPSDEPEATTVPEREQEVFTLGDTPGGVVNSDPRD